MARALPPTKLTPGDELRDLLDRAERRLVNLKGAGPGAIEVLDWMDRIATLMAQLEAGGVDLRPERVRLETVEALLRKRAGQLLREAGPEFPKARQEAEATRERWWWYVDEIAAAARRQQLRRLAFTALGIAAVVIFITVIFPRLLPVDPKVAQVERLRGEAETKLAQGDLEAALAAYEEATQTDPEDPSLVIWVGALLEALGRKDEAQQKYLEAEAVAGGRLRFLLERGRVYGSLGRLDEALADLDEALTLDPNSAEGHFQRGTVLEALNRLGEALAEYQTAADLAGEKKPELVALSRIRMAYLLQRLALPTPVPTP